MVENGEVESRTYVQYSRSLQTHSNLPQRVRRTWYRHKHNHVSLLLILQLPARPRLHSDRRVGYTHVDALELAAPHRGGASGLRTPPTSTRTSATTSPPFPNRVESTIEMRAMVIFNVEIDIDINIAKGARGESL